MNKVLQNPLPQKVCEASILTDNGSEFSNLKAIEFGPDVKGLRAHMCFIVIHHVVFVDNIFHELQDYENNMK